MMHPTYELATEEAKRLASANPRKDFYVLKAITHVGSAPTPIAVTDLEPAGGFNGLGGGSPMSMVPH